MPPHSRPHTTFTVGAYGPRMTTAALLAGRVAAGLLALASVIPLWFGSWWAAWGIATIAQTPDPAVPDGDPCCGHPDTWSEIAVAFLAGEQHHAGCAALSYLAFRLVHFALRGIRPTRTQAVRVAAANGYIAATLGVLLLAL